MAIPTVSASFGQEGDLRQWRDINDQKTKFLLQIMQPTDLIPEVIRSIVIYMNITNAAILYDETFGIIKIFNKFILHHIMIIDNIISFLNI